MTSVTLFVKQCHLLQCIFVYLLVMLLHLVFEPWAWSSDSCSRTNEPTWCQSGLLPKNSSAHANVLGNLLCWIMVCYSDATFLAYSLHILISFFWSSYPCHSAYFGMAVMKCCGGIRVHLNFWLWSFEWISPCLTHSLYCLTYSSAALFLSHLMIRPATLLL